VAPMAVALNSNSQLRSITKTVSAYLALSGLQQLSAVPQLS